MHRLCSNAVIVHHKLCMGHISNHSLHLLACHAVSVSVFPLSLHLLCAITSPFYPPVPIAFLLSPAVHYIFSLDLILSAMRSRSGFKVDITVVFAEAEN